jgi:hypothetical protein
MADEEQRRSQALHLQGPGQLHAEAVPDPAGRQDHEGGEDDRDDAERECKTGERLAPARVLPRVRNAERNKHDRIELRGNAESE